MPKFTKEEVLQYYDVLGLDREDEGLIVPEDTIDLEFITDLYDLNEFDRKISYTYKGLSEAYGILSFMINDDFWYDGKERRNLALSSVIDMIEELSDLDIEDKDNEDMTIDRKNNLKATIINGLCSAGDLVDFRLYEQNASFASIYDKVTSMEKEEKANMVLGHDEDDYPEALKILYYLIAYHKFKKTGSDAQIFDGTAKVSLSNLRRLVNQNLRENIPLNVSDEREEYQSGKILRMSNFKRPNKK